MKQLPKGRTIKSMEKIYINSIQDLLDYRIEKPRVCRDKHKSKELAFCDRLDGSLKEILCDIGYEVISVKREFELQSNRIDYLCKLANRKYLIIEVKVDSDKINKDTVFSFAVGQLLTYRTLFSHEYQISRDNIELLLLTDADSLTALAVINNEGIDIDMLVVGENGVKYYGKDRETQKGNRPENI